jgi:hypothetical protein
MNKEEKEKLIKKYSYYYSDSESFVEEYLENYIEMDQLLKSIFKNINEMKKDYAISLGEASIMLTNKKTKNSYSIRIEF